MDFEVNFSAYNSITSQNPQTSVGGFGDTVTRAKINLFGNEGGGPAGLASRSPSGQRRR